MSEHKKEDLLRQSAKLRLGLLKKFKELENVFENLKSKEPGLFSKKKYLSFRIFKKEKKELPYLLIPTSPIVYDEPLVKPLLDDIKERLRALKLLHQEINKLTHSQETLKFDFLLALIDEKSIGKSWLQIPEFFHELYAKEIVLEHHAHDKPIKSIGIYPVTADNFGDVLFSVKLFYSLKAILKNSVKILLITKHPEIIEKLEGIGFDLNNIVSPDATPNNQVLYVDVLLVYKNAVAKVKSGLRVNLDEYDYSSFFFEEFYDKNEFNFAMGFDKSTYGLLTNLPDVDSKRVLKNFLIKHTGKARTNVLENLHRALIYPSNVPDGAWIYSFYTFLALLAREQMNKDFVLFVWVPKKDSKSRIDFDLFIRKFFVEGQYNWKPLIKGVPSELNKFGEKQYLFGGDGLPNLYTLEKDKKRVNFLFIESFSHEEFVSLLKESDLPVVITGDQSLSEALVLQKPFFYVVPSWKNELFLHLRFLFNELSPELLPFLDVSKFFNNHPSGEASFNSNLAMFPNFANLSNLFTNKSLQDKFKKLCKQISGVDFSVHYLLKEIYKKWNK